MALQLPDWRFKSWDTWSAELSFNNPEIQSLWVSAKEDNWRVWVKNLISSVEYGADYLPNPDGYSDWQGWASDALRAT